MLNPDGVSYTFDERANGYGRGEGIGVVVLKRLGDALRDGDTIRAVVRGSGVNSDGRTSSITQPSSDAQAELIRSTYATAKLPLTDTQYFECHGTGTNIGDPIELSAIAATMGAARRAAGLGPLHIGSVKPNVGHTEGCSGLAGILKAVALLERGTIPPTSGVQKINPRLTLSDWNLSLPTEILPWPTRGQRRISVNSFGFGGSNAHVILDDAYNYLRDRQAPGNHNCEDDNRVEYSDSVMSFDESEAEQPEKCSERIFVFSAKDQAALVRTASNYAAHLSQDEDDQHDEHRLDDLCYTLCARRSHLDFGGHVVASTVNQLVAGLSRGISATRKLVRTGSASNIIWVFTGQGAQWPRMGLELLQYDVFKDSLQTSSRILRSLGCEWDLLDELSSRGESKIHSPDYSQPLCTILQVALVDLLRHWQATPRAAIGHSSGEIAAAYAASYITHADAVALAYYRGQVSSHLLRRGGMLAVSLSQGESQRYLAQLSQGSAVVACVNSPSSVTLSGDTAAIDELEQLLARDGVTTRKLKVQAAYHSPHMQAAASDYLRLVEHVQPRIPEIGNVSMYSSLYGRKVAPEELNSMYWAENLRQPVQFMQAVQATFADRLKGSPIQWSGILEVGPHAALRSPVQQIIASSSRRNVKDAKYMTMLLRDQDAVRTSLIACGQLWALGHPVDLLVANRMKSARTSWKSLPDLPSYPWNHTKSLWHESESFKSVRFPKGPRTDLLGIPEPMQNPMEPRWRNTLRISELPWLEDHQITSTTLYPGAGMIIMALEAALQIKDVARTVRGVHLRQINFHRALVIPSDDTQAVETRISLVPRKETNGHFDFTIFSMVSGSAWIRNCTGIVWLEYESDDIGLPTDHMVWEHHKCRYQQLSDNENRVPMDVASFYKRLQTKGMRYGPTFRNCDSLSTFPSHKLALGSVVIPDTRLVMPAHFEYSHVLHPATLDALFHILLATHDGDLTSEAVVPYSIDTLYIAASQPQGAGQRFVGYGQLQECPMSDEIKRNLFISDEELSALRISMEGLILRKVSSDRPHPISIRQESQRKCNRLVWKQDILPTFRHKPNFTARADLAIMVWVDRLVHKMPLEKVLVLLSLDGDDTANLAPTLAGLAEASRHFKHITAVARDDKSRLILQRILPDSLRVSHMSMKSDESSIPQSSRGYDLVILIGEHGTPSQPFPLSKVRESVKRSGHVIVVDRSVISLGTRTQGAGLAMVEHISAAGQLTMSILSGAQNPTNIPSEVILLLPQAPSQHILRMADLLSKLFVASNVAVHIAFFAHTASYSHKFIISLLEIETAWVHSWKNEDFATFKSIISSARHVLWITRGGLMDSWNNGVEFACSQGLFRTLRNEYPDVCLPHLDLSASFNVCSQQDNMVILTAWLATLEDAVEMEMAEQEGIIHIPRLVADHRLDHELQFSVGTAEPMFARVEDLSVPHRMTLPDGPSQPLWVKDQEMSQPLASTEVEVAVEYMALDYNTTRSTETSPAGREIVGIVRRRGENVTSVHIGQRVILFGRYSCNTHARQEESLVTPFPSIIALGKDLSPQEAVTIFHPYMTVQYALCEVARLSKGQKVLIHDATGAIGQAAIPIAQAAGAEVFALVASKDEKDVLLQHLGFPESHVFDSRTASFVEKIAQMTSGIGVDVVLNTVDGAAAELSTTILADFGYFLDLSGQHGKSPELVLPRNKSNASLIRIDMDKLGVARPELITALFQRTYLALYGGGSVQPIRPQKVFEAPEVPALLQHLKTRSPGRAVLSLRPDTTLLIPAPPPPEFKLDAEATYVLAGGLGTLGLDMAALLIEQGAQHLVFLSRSAGQKNIPQFHEFRSKGVRVEAFPCDVSDAELVSQVFKQLRNEGRVIAGVLQLAMVLEVRSYGAG